MDEEPRVLWKRCKGECREIKPETDFNFIKNKIGRRNICKKCLILYRESPMFDIRYMLSLPKIDEARMSPEGISVLCKYCGTRFVPSYTQMDERKRNYKGKRNHGGFFYCCDECKQLCPEFNFNVYSQTDPRSDIFIEPSEAKLARAASLASKNNLMILQIDELGYNYCEVCGKTHDSDNDKPMEMHHTDEVAKCGCKSVTSSGHILICYKCHKKITAGKIST